jgi:uncharacterized repeat protein (TIGR03803 family)
MLSTALLILAAGASAQEASPTLRTLHSFAGYPSDGGNPQAGATVGEDGVIYGVTISGGSGPCTTNSLGCGTVYSLTPPTTPRGPWTESVLHSFGGGSDGASPFGGLALGGGVLYGTTTSGGAYNNGTVFSVTPPALPGGAWTEAVLHSFTGGDDGGDDEAAVAVGKGGVLYGTTTSGGTGPCSMFYSGCGVVFSLTPPASPGGVWTETVLYNFGGNGGYSFIPLGLSVGSGGVIYGITAEGGSSGDGTVFALKPPAAMGGAWGEAVLYTFTGSNGSFLSGGVAIGSEALYGTADFGGASGDGTVFSLMPPSSPGGVWTESILHNFGGADGNRPNGGVVIGAGGVLYGTTAAGGTSGNGTVFSLTPPTSPSDAWTETILYAFTGASDGSGPQAGVAFGKEGALYGTTYYGGGSGFGTVFQLKP